MNRSLVVITLMVLSTVPAFSQNPPGGPPPADRRINTDRIRQQDMSRREWQLRNFGNEPEAVKDERHLKALMAQTEEDFTRILTLHNEIARALSSNNALDYQFVFGSMSEIKKRASRVQSSLGLRLSPEDALVPVKPEDKNVEMKDALIKLCKQIRSFVTNPVIENPNTIDAQQLLRARRDLEGLIQLSAQIKKDAERLEKAGK